MIVIHLKRCNEAITGYTVTGHADFATHGNDIVCAAVSALTLSTALSLRDLLGLAGRYDTEDGALFVELTTPTADSTLLIQSLFYGLHEIARQYPTHIEIHD